MRLAISLVLLVLLAAGASNAECSGLPVEQLDAGGDGGRIRHGPPGYPPREP